MVSMSSRRRWYGTAAGAVLAGAVAVGVVLALAFGRLVQHLLVDVSASDPRTVVLVAVVMLFAAAAAGALPARRAARIDPASALRSDT